MTVIFPILNAIREEKNMEITAVKEEKRKCESQIQVIICSFERQSGCEVHDVNLRRDEQFGGKTELLFAQLDVRVP
jgi:hypothetical protein